MPQDARVMERTETDFELHVVGGSYRAPVNPPAKSYVLTQYEGEGEKRSYLFVKRVMDIVGAFCGLLLLSPLFLIIAIAIKLDSKGPSIYSQTRIGKDGNPFTMHKFRSMCQDADAMLEDLQDLNEREGPVFKIAKDPRVTKVGKFIRATCIDELPQLLNILKGDMSIVGPRPPLPNEVAEYSLHHMRRLSVTPGLTCYWQVSDRQVSFEEWVESDLQYIREQSLGTDIKIIFQTIRVVLKLRGAK